MKRVLLIAVCRYRIQKDGTLGFVFPFATTSDGLIEAIRKAADKIKFEPALKKGQPVTVVRMVEYEYF